MKQMPRSSLVFIAILSFSLLFHDITLSSAGDRDELVTILEAIESSNADEADISALKAYIDRRIAEPSTDEALLELARAYSGKKGHKEAEEAYRRLLEAFPYSRLKSDALYGLAMILTGSKRHEEARGYIGSILEDREAPAALRAKARALLRDMSVEPGPYSAATPAIGALLPLEGDYARFGDQALSGILLAAGVFGGGDAGVEVIVRNVGTDAESAEASVAELAANKRVSGIVGPLLSATVLDAARYAQAKRIPLIALSQKEGVTDAGDYVFRSFLTPSAQVSSLSAYACRTLGKKRFAVLYPRNRYGTELAGLFEKEVTVQGGDVIRQVSYEQGATDFSSEIKEVFGIQTKEKREGRRQIREFSPTVQVDALFIPDSYEAVQLIAPYLGYFNIKDVLLMGTSAWNSERLTEGAPPELEGAVFVDGFFADGARQATVDFTRRFVEAYGRTPGLLEAEAYDATVALVSAIKGLEPGQMDRESLKYRLRSAKDFKGAGGSLSFNQKGEPEKSLFILTIKAGRIIEAQGS